jgi:predicted Zn-dependent peptidase
MIHDRPLPIDEIVANVEAVDAEAVMRVARRVTASVPTLAALGPVGDLEAFDDISNRLQ